jgi:DNA-binding GntR family transcriptional regulator
MSPEAITAERAYQSLKADILRGRFGTGVALNVHAIAQEHEMSISPLRDAFHRMVGERLLATRPGGGFEIAPLSEESAADLYRWHAFLLKGAVSAGRSLRAGEALLQGLDRIEEGDAEAVVELTAELFYRIGEGAGNVEHLLAIRAAGDRLTMLRLCESRLSNRKTELRALISLAMTGTVRPLQHAIAGYHRRRLRNIETIVGAMSGLERGHK